MMYVAMRDQFSGPQPDIGVLRDIAVKGAADPIRARLYDSVHAQIFTLPPDTLVYPGHDYKGRTVSTVREEMATNARLGGGKTKQQFIEIMSELKLAYPKQIDRAVPANQRCGLLTEL